MRLSRHEILVGEYQNLLNQYFLRRPWHWDFGMTLGPLATPRVHVTVECLVDKIAVVVDKMGNKDKNDKVN